jgi:hypothetical protein
MRILVAALMIMFYGHLLFGCAHIPSDVTACLDNVDDDVRIIDDFAQANYKDALATEVLCLVDSVVTKTLKPQSAHAMPVAGGPDMAVVRANMIEWRKRHP